MNLLFLLFTIIGANASAATSAPATNISLYGDSTQLQLPCGLDTLSPINATFTQGSMSLPGCTNCVTNGTTFNITCNANTAIIDTKVNNTISTQRTSSVMCNQGTIIDTANMQNNNIILPPMQCLQKCFISDNNLCTGNVSSASANNGSGGPSDCSQNGIASVSRKSDGALYMKSNGYYAVDVGTTIDIACQSGASGGNNASIVPYPTNPSSSDSVSNAELNGNFFRTTCQKTIFGNTQLSRQMYCKPVKYCQNSALVLQSTSDDSSIGTQDDRANASGVLSISLPLSTTFGSSVVKYYAGRGGDLSWYVDSGQTNSISIGGQSKPNTQVTIQCNSYSTIQNIQTVTCQDNGTWSNGGVVKCTPIVGCKNSDLRLVDAGTRSSIGSIYPNTSASNVSSVSVNRVNNSNITYYSGKRADNINTWYSDSGKTQFAQLSGMSNIGDTASVTCDQYAVPNSANTVTCQSNGQWSNGGSLSCTGVSGCLNSSIKLSPNLPANGLGTLFPNASQSGVESLTMQVYGQDGQTAYASKRDDANINTWYSNASKNQTVDLIGMTQAGNTMQVQCNGYSNQFAGALPTCNSDGTWANNNVSCSPMLGCLNNALRLSANLPANGIGILYPNSSRSGVESFTMQVYGQDGQTAYASKRDDGDINTWYSDSNKNQVTGLAGMTQAGNTVQVQCNGYSNQFAGALPTCNSDGTWANNNVSCNPVLGCMNNALRLSDNLPSNATGNNSHLASRSGVESLTMQVYGQDGQTAYASKRDDGDINTWYSDSNKNQVTGLAGMTQAGNTVQVQCNGYSNQFAGASPTCNSDGTWANNNINCNPILGCENAQLHLHTGAAPDNAIINARQSPVYNMDRSGVIAINIPMFNNAQYLIAQIPQQLQSGGVSSIGDQIAVTCLPYGGGKNASQNKCNPGNGNNPPAWSDTTIKCELGLACRSANLTVSKGQGFNNDAYQIIWPANPGISTSHISSIYINDSAAGIWTITPTPSGSGSPDPTLPTPTYTLSLPGTTASVTCDQFSTPKTSSSTCLDTGQWSPNGLSCSPNGCNARGVVDKFNTTETVNYTWIGLNNNRYRDNFRNNIADTWGSVTMSTYQYFHDSNYSAGNGIQRLYSYAVTRYACGGDMCDNFAELDNVTSRYPNLYPGYEKMDLKPVNSLGLISNGTNISIGDICAPLTSNNTSAFYRCAYSGWYKSVNTPLVCSQPQSPLNCPNIGLNDTQYGTKTFMYSGTSYSRMMMCVNGVLILQRTKAPLPMPQ